MKTYRYSRFTGWRAEDYAYSTAGLILAFLVVLLCGLADWDAVIAALFNLIEEIT